MLTLLRQEAESLDIPSEIERGLVFSLSLLLSVESGEASHDREIARRRDLLNPYGVDLPESVGRAFDDRVIGMLLYECAQKLGYKPEPRIVTLPSGASFPSYPAPDVNRLPEIDVSHYDLAACARLGKSLFHQIGAAVEEDLEGSFIAGLRFVSAYGSVDPHLTAILSMLLDRVLTPHTLWIVRSVGYPPEMLPAKNLLQKLAFQFVDTKVEGERLFLVFIDRFYFSVPDGRRSDVLDSAISDLLALVARWVHALAASTTLREDVRATVVYLRGQGFSPPSGSNPIDQALVEVYDDVRGQWGFDLTAGEEGLYTGERLDRRLCGIYSIYWRMILNPNWIRIEDLGEPVAFD